MAETPRSSSYKRKSLKAKSYEAVHRVIRARKFKRAGNTNGNNKKFTARSKTLVSKLNTGIETQKTEIVEKIDHELSKKLPRTDKALLRKVKEHIELCHRYIKIIKSEFDTEKLNLNSQLQITNQNLTQLMNNSKDMLLWNPPHLYSANDSLDGTFFSV